MIWNKFWNALFEQIEADTIIQCSTIEIDTLAKQDVFLF